MEALADRLSELDSHVQGIARVVAFYDTLMRRRVDLPALARASAGLAECVAGIRLHDTGRAIRMAPDGRQAAASPSPASSTASIVLDEEEIGTVWLERPGPPGPFDEVLLDRLAIAAAAVSERYGPARTTMADPALVELAISTDTDQAARARALRLLGFPAGRPVTVVAVHANPSPDSPSPATPSPDRVTGRPELPPGPARLPLDRIAHLICPDRPVKAASLAGAGVILATATDGTRFPAGVRAGIATADSPDHSWHQARTALRFTTPRRPVIHYGDLGALALLADVPQEVARGNRDVAAVARLADAPEDLDTLDAYCSTGSLRQAADLLHLHHSSISRRVTQIGRTLGIDLTDPVGLTRARLALATWRLLKQT
ncbi:helix-turn-helix domain-containing protein [Planobispora siamensis]|uniref:PucR C-terminal helix-turn-helix domain-containing protein n=1 Tax=Planobispora siamensis TaxID=936338 RepID=A0A8J3WNQ4_9ACTN|nr:helix-turn-helix domain-containing protein [Planobispora siamensis]GIH94126.1 hypothetical protein Psi01_47560 [Planobispora siamensis]